MPYEETLAAVREKFPEAWWKNRYGHGFDAYTEAELREIKKFKSFDTIRNRILAEEGQRGSDLGSAPPEDLPDYERADLAIGRRQEELRRRAAEKETELPAPPDVAAKGIAGAAADRCYSGSMRVIGIAGWSGAGKPLSLTARRFT